jgi:hypothetical protein
MNGVVDVIIDHNTDSECPNAPTLAVRPEPLDLAGHR